MDGLSAPVLGVAAAIVNLDDDLVWPGSGDGRVDDFDLGALVDDCFLHGRGIVVAVIIILCWHRGNDMGEVHILNK
jgi:hypothetical protein